MFDRFLVPLDGSKLAEKAAVTAAELARQCDAELIFLMVCPNKEGQADAADYLDKMSEAARKEGLDTRAEAYLGEPSERIVRAAAEESVDLIVMSSHGRTGLARTVFGSVAETVMRQAHCPVMVVKAHKPTGGGDQLEFAVA